MFIRYNIGGCSFLETFKFVKYFRFTHCVCFYTEDAKIKIHDVPYDMWKTLANDIFVDGKISISDRLKVERIPYGEEPDEED